MVQVRNIARLFSSPTVVGCDEGRMVINLRRNRKFRTDVTGRRWAVGVYRRDIIGARRYRCLFNGKDVTHRTFYVDSRRGRIRMFELDADGHPYLGSDGLPVEITRRGHVRLRRKKEEQ